MSKSKARPTNQPSTAPAASTEPLTLTETDGPEPGPGEPGSELESSETTPSEGTPVAGTIESTTDEPETSEPDAAELERLAALEKAET